MTLKTNWSYKNWNPNHRSGGTMMGRHLLGTETRHILGLREIIMSWITKHLIKLMKRGVGALYVYHFRQTNHPILASLDSWMTQTKDHSQFWPSIWKSTNRSLTKTLRSIYKVSKIPKRGWLLTRVRPSFKTTLLMRGSKKVNSQLTESTCLDLKIILSTKTTKRKLIQNLHFKGSVEIR